MARDTEKNEYVYVAIPRESQTYQKLLDDAQECGLSVAKLITVRIADWYRGGSAAAPAAASPIALQEDVAAPDLADQSMLNASAALDEWG